MNVNILSENNDIQNNIPELNTTQELSQMKVDVSIDTLELKLLRKFMFESYEKYIYSEYGKDGKCTDNSCDEKIKKGKEFYDTSYIFRVQENIYGVAEYKNTHTKQYWKIEGGVEKDFFAADKNIPPFEHLIEELKKYGLGDSGIAKERARRIRRHNNTLKKVGYGYVIDDKGIYHLLKKSNKSENNIKGYQYKIIFKDGFINNFEKLSTTQYGQEVPKESEEYYEVMKKLR